MNTDYEEALKWFILGYEAAEVWEGRSGQAILVKNKIDEKLLKEYTKLWEYQFKGYWKAVNG